LLPTWWDVFCFSSLLYGRRVTPIPFVTALHRGLGRALLQLRDHPTDTLQPTVLDALLRSTRIDHQCEGTGTSYLLEAAEYAGLLGRLPLHLSGRLHRQLASGERDAWDTAQLADLLGALGERGDERACEVLEQLLPEAVKREDRFTESLIYGLIRAREEAGLRLALHHLGAALAAGAEYRHPESVLWHAERLLGPDSGACLPAWAENDPGIALFLERVRQAEDAPQRERSAAESLGYAQVRDWIDRDAPRISLAARQASEDAAHRLALDLLSEAQPDRLKRLLTFFERRAFPLHPDPLVALTQHPDPEVSELALGTLQRVQHPDLRSLALAFLQARTHVTAAARLLRERLEPGDEHLLSRVMLELETSGDAVELHRFVATAADLLEAQPSEAMLEFMAWSFEHQPCSFCRANLVRTMLRSGPLPAWLEEEAKLDVNEDLRDLLGEGSGQHEREGSTPGV